MKEKAKKSAKTINAVKEPVQMVEKTRQFQAEKPLMQVSQKLIDDLHNKPYKLHEWHKLEPHDYAARVDFAKCFLSLPKNTEY